MKADLTPHMVEILKAYAKCGTIKETAHQLGMKESSLKNQLSTVYHKLNASSAVQAIYIYLTSVNCDHLK